MPDQESRGLTARLARWLDPPRSVGAMKAAEVRPAAQVGVEIGNTGLIRHGGIVAEEPLRELRGAQWTRAVLDMTHNDATIGAILFAVEMLIRQVKWSVEPSSDAAEDVDAAVFTEERLFGMETTWEDTLAEILTMLPWASCWFRAR